jgi:dTDP-4-dehydrorhamnose reductase
MATAPLILVTGANGQLGKALHALQDAFPGFRMVFLSREDLPIHHFELVHNFFKAYQPAYCINCAAYTAVDRAESEQDLARLVNGEAVEVLAKVCVEFNTRFIHISTDYVFDGQSPEPYKETDAVHPVNTYGATKLEGEQRCLEADANAIIVRTAWVYSEFGNNFVKTMLRLMKERPAINVVNDQIGAPTYAVDLAAALLQLIQGGKWEPGIYHYSNTGRISWYDFAVAIRNLSGSTCEVNPIPSSQYPTPAKRPSFSLLDTHKIRTTYGIDIPDWQESLKTCLHKLQHTQH